MDWELIGLVLLAAKAAGWAASWAAEAAGVFSLAFALITIAAKAWVFGFGRRKAPRKDFLPPVTILKPLKGADRELYENLASFCALDYPCFQLLITVASAEDPALDVVARVRRDFPRADISVVVSSGRIGFNPKINNLSNARPLIKHGLLLMSDSDVRVSADFLRRGVAPFRDPRVGLVTSFYRASAPRGLWSRLEALSVNAHFLPQAVTAAAFGMRFAMGAAILVRREAFDRSGGFANLADHLADDFVLGESVQRAGYRLEYSDCLVETIPDVSDAAAHLRHQIRWARTIRLCNPAGYAGTILLHGVSLLTLRCLVLGPNRAAVGLAASILAAKFVASEALAGARPLREAPLRLLLLLPSEWIAFCSWLSGMRSSQVLWRGAVYTVCERGRLEPRAAPLEAAAAAER